MNADTIKVLEVSEEKLTGKNLYVYCNSNPVNFIDLTGMEAVSITALFEVIKVKIVGGILGALASIGISYTISLICGETYTKQNAIIDGGIGFIAGAGYYVAAAGLAGGYMLYSSYKDGDGELVSLIKGIISMLFSFVTTKNIAKAMKVKIDDLTETIIDFPVGVGTGLINQQINHFIGRENNRLDNSSTGYRDHMHTAGNSSTGYRDHMHKTAGYRTHIHYA